MNNIIHNAIFFLFHAGLYECKRKREEYIFIIFLSNKYLDEFKKRKRINGFKECVPLFQISQTKKTFKNFNIASYLTV